MAHPNVWPTLALVLLTATPAASAFVGGGADVPDPLACDSRLHQDGCEVWWETYGNRTVWTPFVVGDELVGIAGDEFGLRVLGISTADGTESWTLPVEPPFWGWGYLETQLLLRHSPSLQLHGSTLFVRATGQSGNESGQFFHELIGAVDVATRSWNWTRWDTVNVDNAYAPFFGRIAVSSDGQRLVQTILTAPSLYSDLVTAAFRVLDAADGTELWRTSEASVRGITWFEDIDISPDGRYVVAVGPKMQEASLALVMDLKRRGAAPRVYEFDVSTFETFTQVVAREDHFLAIGSAYSAYGGPVVSAITYRGALEWSVMAPGTGSAYVQDAKLDPAGERLAFATTYGQGFDMGAQVSVVDVSMGALAWTAFMGPEGLYAAGGVAFSPDGGTLFQVGGAVTFVAPGLGGAIVGVTRALDAADGSVLWQALATQGELFQPVREALINIAVVSDGAHVFVNGDEGEFDEEFPGYTLAYEASGPRPDLLGMPPLPPTGF